MAKVSNQIDRYLPPDYSTGRSVRAPGSRSVGGTGSQTRLAPGGPRTCASVAARSAIPRFHGVPSSLAISRHRAAVAAPNAARASGSADRHDGKRLAKATAAPTAWPASMSRSARAPGSIHAAPRVGQAQSDEAGTFTDDWDVVWGPVGMQQRVAVEVQQQSRRRVVGPPVHGVFDLNVGRSLDALQLGECSLHEQ